MIPLSLFPVGHVKARIGASAAGSHQRNDKDAFGVVETVDLKEFSFAVFKLNKVAEILLAAVPSGLDPEGDSPLGRRMGGRKDDRTGKDIFPSLVNAEQQALASESPDGLAPAGADKAGPCRNILFVKIPANGIVRAESSCRKQQQERCYDTMFDGIHPVTPCKVLVLSNVSWEIYS